MSFTIGSLFDGSGGFPLAAFMSGGVPVWASEVEPYPIAVTRSRFPHMKHLGSVTEIKGNEVDPVDVITFGSPCQDLSVAGKRAGLKHEDNGDEETTRSGLFMDAVRVIKEMLEATNGEYPKYAVWENVPGAFSSNKGEDFRIVLEELIKTVEPTAVMPDVPKTGWSYSDYYCGGEWSIAYRVLDAQYWGVPQRRRRIYLVLDFRGERAGEILFKREGLRGYFETGRTPWKAVTRDVESGVGAADSENECITLEPVCYNGENITSPLNKTNPLPGDPCHTLGTDSRNYVVYSDIVLDDQGGSQINVRNDDKCPTLRAEMHGNMSCVMKPSICLQGNGIDRTEASGCNGKGYIEDVSYTLNTMDRHAVAFTMQRFGDYKDCGVSSSLKQRDYKDATDLVVTGVDCRNFTETPELYPTLQAKPNGGQSLNYSGAVRTQYIVRRLTPTECARLQGFPDEWGHPDNKDDFTDEEYRFWLNVRNTHAEINGKTVKEYTKSQMLTWYNKLHTDSSEYKLWGNGIALPCALYVLQGIADTFN